MTMVSAIRAFAVVGRLSPLVSVTNSGVCD
jgi:hypothetical protein